MLDYLFTWVSSLSYLGFWFLTVGLSAWVFYSVQDLAQGVYTLLTPALITQARLPFLTLLDLWLPNWATFHAWMTPFFCRGSDFPIQTASPWRYFLYSALDLPLYVRLLHPRDTFRILLGIIPHAKLDLCLHGNCPYPDQALILIPGHTSTDILFLPWLAYDTLCEATL